MTIFWLRLYELFWLSAAHFLAEFSLQQAWMVERKKKGDLYILLGHCLIWTGALALVLSAFGNLQPWKILFLLLGHMFCDGFKHCLKVPVSDWLDQLFHFIQILIVLTL